MNRTRLVRSVLFLCCGWSSVRCRAIDTDSIPYLGSREQQAVVVVRDELQTAEGTGFVISYDAAKRVAYVLTAHHVAEAGNPVVTFFDGEETGARIVLQSAAKDLCALAVPRRRQTPVLHIADFSKPLQELAFVVAVGRDEQGVKQHVGAYIEDEHFTQDGMDAQVVSVSVASLPGFSGGPIVASSGAGQAEVIGLLTHGSPALTSGPNAAELSAFLVAAGVPVGASPPNNGVVRGELPDDDAANHSPGANLAGVHDGVADFLDDDIDDDFLDDDYADFMEIVGIDEDFDASLAHLPQDVAPQRPRTVPPNNTTPAPLGPAPRPRIYRQVIVAPGSGVRIVIETVFQ